MLGVLPAKRDAPYPATSDRRWLRFNVSGTLGHVIEPASTTSTPWPDAGPRLTGRVAVVTGSSSGHGRAIALRLAREGAAVVCLDLRKAALAEGFEEDIDVDTDDVIRGHGGRAEFVTADVTSAEAVEEAADRAVDAFGRLDVWVNNAGTFMGLKGVLEESPEQFDRTVEVNLKGAWFGCRAAVRRMRDQDVVGRSRGRIVNIGSIAGSLGQANIGGYASSKGAVHNLTRNLAIELAPEQINVNAVAPGYFPTAMNRVFWDDPESLAAVQDLHPLPLGVPDDIAAATAFFASDDAAFVTGTVLPVDGGVLAK
jgi:NAD(P)-dependent dehydrogenase (short-subunit alcohol dehydrogenase family)